ncbi:glycosyltransferase [Thermasporomyces composti]|jgi:glycosyltransferase involved in cell wall biosynthesis|uniref:Glycosyltransferase involved in cell wall biosynthesis n=1 Tax=Thermasporomyces composti TaxID=696763 RepID=A0A3D9V925_THECX|nr:glycosyltransferase [Thermasporomyces composti]REF36670.1 glycosyltransferase involved in cell wall biosynthesis [Thermasporomyces composti]
MLITRRLGYEPSLALDDALRALSAMDWSRAGAGLLAYYPVVRGNPFQAMLYSQLGDAGLTPVPTYDPDTTLRLARAVAGSGLHLVVHVHWLNVVMAKAADEADARDRLKRYLDQLSQLKEQGARILWTVHNVLPHETRFERLEAELRQGVVNLAERVHVMSPRTRELVSPWFDIPEEKLLAVPHPAYHDVYPSWMTKQQARLELGMPPDVTAFALVGRVQPYKGLTELLDAFDRLCEREPGRYALIVAGPTNQEEETRAFRERVLTHPAVYAALRKIPDDEMQVYLRAADVAVFPYRRSLNSGALALALTFGLPVVLREDSGEAARVSPSYALRYDGDDPDGLLTALAQARSLVTPRARAAALGAAARISPSRVSRAFAAAVRAWLDSGGSHP